MTKDEIINNILEFNIKYLDRTLLESLDETKIKILYYSLKCLSYNKRFMKIRMINIINKCLPDKYNIVDLYTLDFDAIKNIYVCDVCMTNEERFLQYQNGSYENQKAEALKNQEDLVLSFSEEENMMAFIASAPESEILFYEYIKSNEDIARLKQKLDEVEKEIEDDAMRLFTSHHRNWASKADCQKDISENRIKASNIKALIDSWENRQEQISLRLTRLGVLPESNVKNFGGRK